MYRSKKLEINYRLLAWTVFFLAVFAMIGVVGYVLQQSRSVAKLESQSNKLLKDKNYNEAFEKLRLLTKLKPKDGSKKLQLAFCADEIADNTSQGIQEVVKLNMAALAICQADAKLEGNIPEIRQRLIKRLSQLGRFEDAIDQINRLVGPKVDLELQRCYTIAKVRLWLDGRGLDAASGSSTGLPNWFESLVALPPVDLLFKTHVEVSDDFEIAGMLVDLCLGDPAKLGGSILAGESRDTLKTRAQSIVERLVSDRPQDPYAWLLRYEISSRDAKVGLSEEDIERAVGLGKNDYKVLLVAGKLYLDRAKRVIGISNRLRREQYLNRALELFESSKAINPREAQTYLNIGEIQGLMGDLDKAIETWRDGKRVCSERVSPLDFRIADALVGQKKIAEAGEALTLMDQSFRSEFLILDRSERAAFTRQASESWARYHVANGDFQVATKLLEDLLAKQNDLDAVNRAGTYSTLGDCYRQTGQFDRSASAYEQAILLSPNNQEYRRRAAGAWFSAGRYLESYKQHLLVEPKEPNDWVQICDVILEIQRQSGQDSNYWFTFEKGISETRRLMTLNPDAFQATWLLEILQIDANVMRAYDATRMSVIRSASEQLWEVVEREKFSSDPLRAAIARWKAWEQPTYLSKVSESLKTELDSVVSTVEKAELLTILGSDLQAKELLEKGLQEQPDNGLIQEAVRRFELINMPFEKAVGSIRSLKIGGWMAARRLAWSTLKRPMVLSPQEQRDQELRAKRIADRFSELKTVEELLEEFEGPEGTEWRYIKARRLLAEATDPEKLNAIELLDLLGFLDRKRPEWPETHLLTAMFYETQGNRSRAIRGYRNAIQFGNNDLNTYERLVNLLYEQGLISDASVVLERLGNRAYASRPLAAISLQLASESDRDQLASAQFGTQMRPQDPMAWVWLAEVIELQCRNQPDQIRQEAIASAEAAFDKAAALSKPEDLRVAMARFNFYHAIDNNEGQKTVLDQIQQSPTIDPAVQSVAVGQIHESLGQTEQAIEDYRKAISLGANDLELRTRITQLYVKDDRLEEAVVNLRETYDRHPEDAPTRRRLATLLANRSLDEDWQEVSELLSPREQSNSPDDVRLQVVLLSQKNDINSLQQAQSLLERLVELPNVRTDGDRFQLASLYMRTSRLLEFSPGREIEAVQTQEAIGRMLKLVASGAAPKPEYVYTYADYLIRQKRFFDAIEESQKLDAIAPGSFPAMLLKARLTKLDGKKDAAVYTVMAWLEDKRKADGSSENPTKTAEYLVRAGQALQILEEPAESQKLLREAYKLDPRAGINYIRSVLLTDDFSTRNNAVRFLMDRLKSEGTNESAVLLSLLIRKGDTDEDLIASAQKQLVEYSVSQKDDRKILQSLADLWVWRGNESQAIETFRRIVQDRPNDVVALNNLAMLLADAPNASEDALQYIDRAIALVGAKPAIIDTKAYVLLRIGKYNEAISIWKALLDKNGKPTIRFHLYQAYLKNNQGEQAKEILSMINFEELRKLPLTTTDQRELAALADSSR
jgi:tetratricopeptide (TPR) repeat protein